MKKRIRIQGILIFLAVVIIIALPKFVFPHWKKEPLDGLLDALGIAVVLLGFVFRISARGYKEERSLSGKKLVKDGPYHLMQHPMYFGTLLIGVGIILVLFKLWIFSLFLVIYFSIYIPQIKKEEAILSKCFGQEYNEYCKATPKYFPKFDYLLNLKEYAPLKLSWIKKELLPLLAVIAAILAIEIWEDIRLFGYKQFFKELLELFFIIMAFAMIAIFLLRRE